MDLRSLPLVLREEIMVAISRKTGRCPHAVVCSDWLQLAHATQEAVQLRTGAEMSTVDLSDQISSFPNIRILYAGPDSLQQLTGTFLQSLSACPLLEDLSLEASQKQHPPAVDLTAETIANGGDCVSDVPQSDLDSFFRSHPRLKSLRLKAVCRGWDSLPHSVVALSQLSSLEFAVGIPFPEQSPLMFNLERQDAYPGFHSLPPLPAGALPSLGALHVILRSSGALDTLFATWHQLTELHLQVPQGVPRVPDSIGNMRRLKELYLHLADHHSLPDTIGSLSKLQRLRVFGAGVEALPEAVGSLQELQSVILHCPFLGSLPEGVGQWRKLRAVDTSACQLMEELPESASNWTAVTRLSLGQSARSMASLLPQYSRLRKLCIHQVQGVQGLPNCLSEVQGLLRLDIDCCPSLFTLHDVLTGQLASTLQCLKISACPRLRVISQAGKTFSMTSLKILVIAQCPMLRPPEDMSGVRGLKYLGLGSCQCSQVPAGIEELTSLESLSLCNIPITTLPHNLTLVSSLVTLRLIGLMIEKVPEGITGLKALRYLVLRSLPRLSQLPASFGALQGLEDLEVEGCPLLRVNEEDVKGFPQLPMSVLERLRGSGVLV